VQVNISRLIMNVFYKVQTYMLAGKRTSFCQNIITKRVKTIIWLYRLYSYICKN
jgi:hypothetical protein